MVRFGGLSLSPLCLSLLLLSFSLRLSLLPLGIVFSRVAGKKQPWQDLPKVVFPILLSPLSSRQQQVRKVGI